MFEILNEPVEIRLAKAKDKKTDAEMLEVLSHDSFWFVRNFVATNPSAEYRTLITLLQDDDFRVRFEAEKNLKKKSLDNKIEEAGLKRETVKSSGRNDYFKEAK